MTEYSRKLLGQIRIAEMLWVCQGALPSARLTWSQSRCLGVLVSKQMGLGSPTHLVGQGQQCIGSLWASETAKASWRPGWGQQGS